MKKRSAPESQGREGKMRAATPFAFQAPAVKHLLVTLAIYVLALAALAVFVLRALRWGQA